MSVCDHYQNITPEMFLNTFAEILDTGVVPNKKIEAKSTTGYTDNPTVKYGKREISIETELDGTSYKMYAIQDNNYGLDKYIIGTNNTEMELVLVEDRRRFYNFMNKYCCAGYDFDDTLTVMYQKFVKAK